MRYRIMFASIALVLGVAGISIAVDPTIENVTVGGQVHALDGVDSYRAADYLVLYTAEQGSSTGTNQYGYEAAVVDGIVVDAADGVGDMAIPVGGYVLSGHGHGSSRAWLETYGTVGAAVSLDGVPPPPPPVADGVVVAGQDRPLDGTNTYRAADLLVRYTSAHGGTTLTNQYGYEAAVVDGVVVDVQNGVGSMLIPTDGYVLSGHGLSRSWLKAHATPGAEVSVGETVVDPPGAEQLLPDLGIRSLREFEITYLGEQKLLKFPVVTTNVGAGPMEVSSVRSSPTSTLWDGWQRVSMSDGTTADLPSTGAQFYYAGDGHDHWHILDFDLYELYDVAGQVRYQGEKHGFCFQDNTEYRDWPGNPDHPESPATAVYLPEEACGLGQPDAVDVTHGLSPGWGDTYPATLPDQGIDVTDLPDGEYVVKVTVDWQGFWQEMNNNNNSATARVQITGDTVTLLTADDGQ